MRKKKKKNIKSKNNLVSKQESSKVVLKPTSMKQIWVPKKQSSNVAMNLNPKPKVVENSYK